MINKHGGLETDDVDLAARCRKHVVRGVHLAANQTGEFF